MEPLNAIAEKTRAAYNLAAERYYVLFHNEMAEKEYDRKLLDGFTNRFQPGAKILDAGCGPAAHIGRYLADKGLKVHGLDLSDRCVEIARNHNPGMEILRGDLAAMPYDDESFDGLIAYYSIIDTPRRFVPLLFAEFHRVLKRGGSLLVAVKAGETEGYIHDLLDHESEIYFALFTEREIEEYFTGAGFRVEFLEMRNPYDFEIDNDRVFAIGVKA